MSTLPALFADLLRKFKKLTEQKWPALGLCFTVGSFSALSMAPANQWWVLFIGLSVLYLTLSSSPSKMRSFGLGWMFGFGYFLFSLSWIGNALLVEGNPYKWAWPLAVSGLPALLAFFPAFATLLIHRICNLKSALGWLGFILILSVFEFLRGYLFTGFPWNLFGYTWANHLEIIQILSLGNVYFLTGLTILWGCTAGFCLVSEQKQRNIAVLLALTSFAFCYSFGLARLNSAPTQDHENIEVRIVQPNVPQAEKWQRDKMAGHFQKLIELSKNSEDTDNTTYIVWPETALNFRVMNDPQALSKIKNMLGTYKSASLFTGILLHDSEKSTFSNSLVMIDQNGEMKNIYNKHHLVPFGEYIPFQKWIPLAPVVQFKGFEKGDGLKTLETPESVKYSPLICYEIIFPGRSTATSSPDFIINVTNDAWYGRSAGPHQHLTQALYRAIETGMPVIRSANTGISALISPYGHIVSQSNLFEDFSKSTALPQKIAK